MKKKVKFNFCVFILAILTTRAFAQQYKELPDNLNISVSRFPVDRVFLRDGESDKKTILPKGDYQINRVIGQSRQSDYFSVRDNGLLNGTLSLVNENEKRIIHIEDSAISSIEVYKDGDLRSKQVFEKYKDSILRSEILDGDGRVLSKIQRFFTRRDSLKTIETSYNKKGIKVKFSDEVKGIKEFYNDQGEITKSEEKRNKELIQKTYENGKLKLLTIGSFPYSYFEQYDELGKIELKQYVENGITKTASYEAGKLIGKEYSIGDKTIAEYYKNEKLDKKDVSFIKNSKYYTQRYDAKGKLLKTEVSDMEEKK